MANPDVTEMVAEHLKRNGFDGLYSEGICACLNDDLAPCGEIQSDCIAGYKSKCPGQNNKNEDDNCEISEGCDFHIGEKKPTEKVNDEAGD